MACPPNGGHDRRLLVLIGCGICALASSQTHREELDPADDQDERDALQDHQADDSREQQRDADREDHGHRGAEPVKPRGKPAHQHPRRAERQDERDHHRIGRALVQCLVEGERHGAGGRKAQADRDDEERHDPCAVCARDPAGRERLLDRVAHRQGERRDHESRDDERRVEEVSRQVVEHPQSAVVQMPPQRVGGHRRGREDPRQRDRCGVQDRRARHTCAELGERRRLIAGSRSGEGWGKGEGGHRLHDVGTLGVRRTPTVTSPHYPRIKRLILSSPPRAPANTEHRTVRD